jgi:hypothetical protein
MALLYLYFHVCNLTIKISPLHNIPASIKYTRKLYTLSLTRVNNYVYTYTSIYNVVGRQIGRVGDFVTYYTIWEKEHKRIYRERRNFHKKEND